MKIVPVISSSTTSSDTEDNFDELQEICNDFAKLF